MKGLQLSKELKGVEVELAEQSVTKAAVHHRGNKHKHEDDNDDIYAANKAITKRKYRELEEIDQQISHLKQSIRMPLPALPPPNIPPQPMQRIPAMSFIPSGQHFQNHPKNAFSTPQPPQHEPHNHGFMSAPYNNHNANINQYNPHVSPLINNAHNIIAPQNFPPNRSGEQVHSTQPMSDYQGADNFWADLEPRPPPITQKSKLNGNKHPRARHLIQSNKRHVPARKQRKTNQVQEKPRWR